MRLLQLGTGVTRHAGLLGRLVLSEEESTTTDLVGLTRHAVELATGLTLKLMCVEVLAGGERGLVVRPRPRRRLRRGFRRRALAARCQGRAPSSGCGELPAAPASRFEHPVLGME